MKNCSYCGRENTDEALHCNECGTEFEREVMASESDNDRFHDEVKSVTIRTFTSHDAGNIARSNLEAHGIECWINSEDASGMLPSLTAPGGVRLSVHASDAEAAIALLNTQASPAEINQIETESNVTSSSKNVPRKKLAFVQILIGIVVGVILCLFYQWSSKLGKKTYYNYTDDGKCDEAWIYRDGHLIEHLEDRNLDGAWDHWVYYEHGRMVRSELDNNFDGKADVFWTFSGDRMDTLQKDNDFNGVPDEFCTYKYGMLQQMDVRHDGAKFTTQRWIYQNGVLAEIWRGGDSDGHFKEVVRYDPFFNPISTNIPAAFPLQSPAAK